MPKTSDARLQANDKYLKSLDEFKIRMPKGHKEIAKARAERLGKSLNSYILDLIRNDLENDTDFLFQNEVSC